MFFLIFAVISHAGTAFTTDKNTGQPMLLCNAPCGLLLELSNLFLSFLKSIIIDYRLMGSIDDNPVGFIVDRYSSWLAVVCCVVPTDFTDVNRVLNDVLNGAVLPCGSASGLNTLLVKAVGNRHQTIALIHEHVKNSADRIGILIRINTGGF